ncbi:hypothetical protein E4U52_001043 [Claviceps spartinae]|uniref:Uncharacterized protein n=2 Tax=Claviceps TaxID=5110 RepID=A0A9P7SSN8_9HYPO|nr:hypothetical protein E4U53_005256 [Claviceps sorghi]KAG5912666.1 hypothetical protein E4U61_000222 [Claviceps capensis]KAG5926914.1 hypothetical protein E4U60_000305 [Claviceps pazoutovae]KAG5949797.1 hypothetical protein E4U58_001892 [Claviceps cyperi]KAG5969780.1 hypothetical protein E4U55_001989 [Claviceps digitariae]KAG5979873.1 hypothetical protein E4U54_006865 [Claviceps lovelessii]KAG5980302.1 hypothetical protein E4U43_006756 [Claviceps pusilla]KAG5985719.1 hypothetical protein E4
MIECQCVAELRQVNVVNGQYEPYDHTGHKLTTCTKATDDVKVGTGKGESHEEMESQRRPRRGTSLGVDGRVIGQHEGQTWSKAEAEAGETNETGWKTDVGRATNMGKNGGTRELDMGMKALLNLD